MQEKSERGGWPSGEGEMARRIRAHDWAATALGPIEHWPQSLRHTVETMLAHPLAMCVLWGPELIELYNGPYARMLGVRHPASLGSSLFDQWPEMRHLNQPLVERVWAGESVQVMQGHSPGARIGRIEDPGYSIAYSPLRGDDGAIAGVLVTAFETTGRVPADKERDRIEAVLRQSEARQAFLLELSDALRPLRDPVAIQEKACGLLAEQLNVDRAYYVEVNEASGLARVARDFVRGGAFSLAGEHRLADFAWSVAILRRGECHVVADTRTSDLVPQADRPASAALGIIACAGAPLIKDDRLVGALCVTNAQARSWSEVEVDLLRDVGERIWAAVERARAGSALSESEERFRTMAEAIEDVFYMTDLDRGALLYLSPAYERIWGRPRAELEADLSTFADTLHPDDRAAFVAGKEAQEQGEPIVAEYRIQRPDGTMRWIYDRSFPVPGAQGRRSAGVASDITARRQAEAARRESEERFRTVVESARDYAIFTTDAEGRIETWPPGAEAVFGWTAEEALGQSADITFTPEDRASGQPQKEMEEAREKGVAPNVRWHLRKDGRRVFIEGSTRLLHDGPASPEGFLKIGQDITERHRAEQLLKESEAQLQVMVAELQHRTRNLMAVVRSIANQTMTRTGPTEAFREQFNDRLGALSRVQGLLSRSIQEPITLRRLIGMELDALSADTLGDRVLVEGPEVPLRKSTVQTFALALHELATNARKYGALSDGAGRLSVTWTTHRVSGEERRLVLQWLEEGIDATREATSPITSGGYGRELIERALPYALKAKTRYELGGTELRCTIDMPLDGDSMERPGAGQS